MTEIIKDKPTAAVCRGCGAPIFWVTMWSGKQMPVEKKRIVIISRIKDDVWATASGYAPHEGNCPKVGDLKNDHYDD